MKMEHKTPLLEDRISRQVTLNNQIADLILTLENQVKELRKEYNSGLLAVNELNLLKSLKEKKFALLNLETMQFIEPKFI